MKNNKYFVLGMMVMPLALLGLGVVYASNVATPNTFVAGTTAVADQVNANFAAHAAGINDNDARLDAIEATLMSGSGLPLRLVRGVVSGAGTVVGGEGFTVTHTVGTGRYLCTFDTPFMDPVAPVSTAMGFFGNYASANNISNDSFDVTLHDATGTPVDGLFTILVWGQ